MAHCPYCGESLADNAVQCTRCSMLLDDDAAPAEEAPKAKAVGGSGARASAPTAPSPPAAKKTEPCPKCDRPVPVTAHRCKSCGHAIRQVVSDETRASEAAFKRNVYLGVAGAL